MTSARTFFSSPAISADTIPSVVSGHYIWRRRNLLFFSPFFFLLPSCCFFTGFISSPAAWTHCYAVQIITLIICIDNNKNLKYFHIHSLLLYIILMRYIVHCMTLTQLIIDVISPAATSYLGQLQLMITKKQYCFGKIDFAFIAIWTIMSK